MDCLDCHNRPAHTLEPCPERAVDIAIATGQFARVAIRASRSGGGAEGQVHLGEAAQTGIDARLRKSYASHASDRR